MPTLSVWYLHADLLCILTIPGGVGVGGVGGVGVGAGDSNFHVHPLVAFAKALSLSYLVKVLSRLCVARTTLKFDAVGNCTRMS